MTTQTAVRFKENTTHRTSLYTFTITKITRHFVFIEITQGDKVVAEFRRKPKVELEERIDLFAKLQRTEVVDFVGVKLQAIDFE